MNHTRHTSLSVSELNGSNLMDAVIFGPGDEKIGAVAHVHGVGDMMQVIVDVGGFLGLGSKSVALEVQQINFMRDEGDTIHGVTSMTKEQVKDLPEHDHH